MPRLATRSSVCRSMMCLEQHPSGPACKLRYFSHLLWRPSAVRGLLSGGRGAVCCGAFDSTRTMKTAEWDERPVNMDAIGKDGRAIGDRLEYALSRRYAHALLA